MGSYSKSPHTIEAFRQLISDGIITYRNAHGTEATRSNIKCEKIWPAYEKTCDPLCAEATLAQVEVFHDALRQMEEEGLLTAIWSTKTASYTKICVTQEQAAQLAKMSGRLLKTEFYGALKDIAIAEFGMSICPQLKTRIASEPQAFVQGICRYSSGTEADLMAATEHLRTICRCVTETYGNEEDILERNFSIKMGLGSKGYDKIKGTVASILSDSQPYDENDVLKKYHVLQSPPRVGIRGGAVIVMEDGDRFSLANRGAIYVERPFFEQIARIETGKVYTVENLTTFHSLPFPEDGLVVYTEGFPSFLVTDLIEKATVDNALPNVFHCGDMDAYGYKILRSMDERLSAKVKSFCMGLAEYEIHKDMAINMSVGNRTEFERMLNDDYYSRSEKALFQKLLQDGKVLEQECLSV